MHLMQSAQSFDALFHDMASMALRKSHLSLASTTYTLFAQLSEFIVTGRLAAKIDKVSNVVETVGAFERQSNYNTLIKEGDLLLNRIQKLSKVVDVE